MYYISLLISFFTYFRRRLFNEIPDESDYTPLPEDRPGGFNWGGEDAQNEVPPNEE